jgi:hypothetical protein
LSLKDGGLDNPHADCNDYEMGDKGKNYLDGTCSDDWNDGNDYCDDGDNDDAVVYS